MNKEKYKVKLDNFEGPLDLLLHLIDKNEINIYDIPIAKITDQYLQYIHESEILDLDIASEFLVMAATLLAIKAKLLLPKPPKEVEEEEDKDPREELVLRLLEYKKYKEVAKVLKEKEIEMRKVFVREIDEGKLLKEFGPKNPVENISINDLFEVFKTVLEKAKNSEPVYEIAPEEVKIEDCINDVLTLLENNPKGLSFMELFPSGISRIKIIVTFLAVLELIKQKKIGFRQRRMFEEIYLFLLDKDE